MGKNQNFQEFIGVSPLQKTLRNELIPTETTKKNITQLDLLTEDEIRAQNREKLKEMMDDYYRDAFSVMPTSQQRTSTACATGYSC